MGGGRRKKVLSGCDGRWNPHPARTTGATRTGDYQQNLFFSCLVVQLFEWSGRERGRIVSNRGLFREVHRVLYHTIIYCHVVTKQCLR